LTPARRAGPAYWACGGGVESRVGAVPLPRAAALLNFYNSAAREQTRRSDSAAASFCEARAGDLAAAIDSARAWRRVGRGLTPGTFARRTNFRSYG